MIAEGPLDSTSKQEEEDDIPGQVSQAVMDEEARDELRRFSYWICG